MSKRQQLAGIYAMLDRAAHDASQVGHGLIATLAAAAAEAAREELALLDRSAPRHLSDTGPRHRSEREKADSFA